MTGRDPQLTEAIIIWRSGRLVPSDLWATLAARGYNMARLEAQHFDF